MNKKKYKKLTNKSIDENELLNQKIELIFKHKQLINVRESFRTKLIL